MEPDAGPMPMGGRPVPECRLAHTIHVDSAVMAVAATCTHIYCGLTTVLDCPGDILVIKVETFLPQQRLEGHTKSVSRLLLNPDESLLFSSAADDTIRVRTGI